MARRFTLFALLFALFIPAASARQQTDDLAVIEQVATPLAGYAAALRELAGRASDETAAVLTQAAERLDRAVDGARESGAQATLRVRLRFVLDDLAEVSRRIDRSDRDRLDEVRDGIEEALEDLEEARRTAIAGRRGESPEGDWSWQRDAERHDREADGDNGDARRVDGDDEDGDNDDVRYGDRRREARDRWRSARNRFRGRAPSFAGEFGDRWPYYETGPYAATPALRYNRVDGFVLGFGRAPLTWDSYDRLRIYGRGGYAFAMEDWRYLIGGEARLGRAYRDEQVDLKVGVSYRHDTATDDAWKISPIENSIGAFFVRSDFYDWYDAEGTSVYAIVRATPYAQASVVYRSEDHTSLARNTEWSLFGGDDFRPNPVIDGGRLQSVSVIVDGGLIRGFRAVPHGVAFRAEAEIGSGMGGDFDFSRYIGDVHAYARTGPASGLAVRLRAGTSTGTLPLQRTFTLGGIGTTRAYPSHSLRGDRMLLANVEYTLYGRDAFDDLFEDLSVFGLFDAGWTDGGTGRAFSMDDVAPSAGFGVGFGDRAARLELAFPLRDMGTGMEPTLWLRLSPTL